MSNNVVELHKQEKKVRVWAHDCPIKGFRYVNRGSNCVHCKRSFETEIQMYLENKGYDDLG